MSLTHCLNGAAPRSIIKALAVAMPLLAVTVACSPDVNTRGHQLSMSQLASIEPGQSSRAQVASLLGSPSSTSLFDGGETWYYIGARTTQYAVFTTRELERSVVAIHFDGNGTVSDVRSLNKEDGTEVTLVDRTTPTAGHSLNFLQQMLGNVGRFNTDEQAGN